MAAARVSAHKERTDMEAMEGAKRPRDTLFRAARDSGTSKSLILLASGHINALHPCIEHLALQQKQHMRETQPRQE
jgi:hypothetical protein